MHDLKIEKMKTTDIANVVEIDKYSFGLHHWKENSFLSEISADYSIYLVIKSDKHVIGYIGSWVIGDEGHITTLAIDQNYRRKGLADKLLYSLIRKMISKQVKWLTLEVRISNTPAINLYTKFRFKQIGIRKKYYQDNNEDGLILWTENIQTESYNTLLQTLNINF